MESSSTGYHSQALARGIAVLRTLSSARNPQSLGDLHRVLDLPRSTLIRLLAVLEEEQLVVRSSQEPDARWGLGHGVLTLANGYRRRVDAEGLARPILARVAQATAHTTNLGVLAGTSVVHVCVAEPDRAIRYRSTSGSFDHTYCTGLGKMLLAQLEPRARERHIPAEPFAAYTPATLTTREALDVELAITRQRAYSIDAEERDPGVRCIAVPVKLSEAEDGAPVALSVSGPAAELSGLSQEHVLETLLAAAAEIRENETLAHALRVTAALPGLPAEVPA